MKVAGPSRVRAWRRSLLAALLIGPSVIGSTAPNRASAASSARRVIERLDQAAQNAMVGVSWFTGCPVPLRDLRRVTIAFVDFSGASRTGVIVVHRDVATAVGRVFAGLDAARIPLASVEPIEAFGGDDDRSTLANNTSGFNCRPSFGPDGAPTRRWSQHAYGRAVDVNPVQNPYVLADGSVLDPAARRYVDRRLGEPGMVVAGGAVVKAFAAEGWKWGGNWRSTKDYQHFSVTGR